MRTCIRNRGCRPGEEFFRQTRQIFAGILYVWQENLTQYGGKRPVRAVFEVANTGSEGAKNVPGARSVRDIFISVKALQRLGGSLDLRLA